MQSRIKREMYLLTLLALAFFLSLPIAAQGQTEADQTAQVKALLAKGKEFWKQGDFAKTHSYLDDALRLKPKSYQILAMRGFLNSQEGNFNQAVEDLKFAAIYARSEGQVEASKKLFAKALEYESMFTNYSKNKIAQVQAQTAPAAAASAKTKSQPHQATKIK